MNQTIWYFDAISTLSTGAKSSGRLVFLTEAEAIQVRELWIAGGYTVGSIGSEVRWVDPLTGSIGGTPAATGPVVTATTTPSSPPVNPATAGVWAGGSAANPMYRFIIAGLVAGTYDTGANLAGCSRSNPTACDPKQFGSLYDAVQYAVKRGEVPYMVYSEDEVWGIIAGVKPINPTQVISPGNVAAPGGVAPNPAASAPLGDNTLLYVGAAVLAFLVLS